LINRISLLLAESLWQDF